MKVGDKFILNKKCACGHFYGKVTWTIKKLFKGGRDDPYGGGDVDWAQVQRDTREYDTFELPVSDIQFNIDRGFTRSSA